MPRRTSGPAESARAALSPRSAYATTGSSVDNAAPLVATGQRRTPDHAPTIRYDPYEVMSARSRGGRTPAEQASGVAVPALVLAGEASPAFMADAGRRIAEALPDGEFHLLPGQDHVVPPEILAPVLVDFLTRRHTSRN